MVIRPSTPPHTRAPTGCLGDPAASPMNSDDTPSPARLAHTCHRHKPHCRLTRRRRYPGRLEPQGPPLLLSDPRLHQRLEHFPVKLVRIGRFGNSLRIPEV
jgi:hypothetical protein